MPLLDIRDLTVQYTVDDETAVHAVDDVSLSIDHGEIFGLVGESGCGKTTLAKAIIRLLDRNGSIVDGEIRYKNRDLASLTDREIRDIRWAEISVIPQGSMSGLNPVYKVGDQIAEAITRHEPEVPREAAEQRGRDLLERVGVEPERGDDYAHELSGGMKQRAMIAMALACNPDLIIADEPTTALDVIVQDQVLDEFEAILGEMGVSIIIISHDISVIAETCDRVGVMYGGKLMEIGPADDVFGNPANPYTLGLKNSFPNVAKKQDQLVSIPGSASSLENPSPGCRFRDRCPFATEQCTTEHPPLYTMSPDHRSACYHLERLDEIRSEAKREETWR